MDEKQQQLTSILNPTKIVQLNDLTKTKLSALQTRVVVMILSKINVVLRGPERMGKAFVSRHACKILKVLDENVELLVKGFTITPAGEIKTDGKLTNEMQNQIRTCSVLLIDEIPTEASPAATYLAHLDFLCRVLKGDSLPFGGIRIIAIQNTVSESNLSIVDPHADVSMVLFS